MRSRAHFGVVDPSGQLLGDSITFTPERVVHEDTNWRESKSARLALTWAVTDSLSITPSVFYQREYAHDVIDDYWVSLSNPSKGVFRIPRFEVVPPDATHTAFEAPSAQPSTDEFVVTSLKLEYETDNFIVISDTSYFDRESIRPSITPFCIRSSMPVPSHSRGISRSRI